jgi:hypothetical protein
LPSNSFNNQFEAFSVAKAESGMMLAGDGVGCDWLVAEKEGNLKRKQRMWIEERKIGFWFPVKRRGDNWVFSLHKPKYCGVPITVPQARVKMQ